MTQTNNKVALVTGAGAGIGRAAAKALLQGGYQVVLTGRNLEKLQKAIADIGGNDENCLAVSCDVGNPDQVKKLFAAIKEKFGRFIQRMMIKISRNKVELSIVQPRRGGFGWGENRNNFEKFVFDLFQKYGYNKESLYINFV